jgi:hypothetical protein
MTRRPVGLHITRALGFLVAPLAASAQQSPKVSPVGFLNVPAPLRLPYEQAFRHGRLNSATWSASLVPSRSALLRNKGGRRT